MSDARTEHDRDWQPSGNPWLIAVVVTVAAFMEVLDTTIINVALPYIAGTMASSEDEATWALTSYLVANGIVLVVSGHLGRLLGRKRYFLICIVGFTVFSFLCGLAQSLSELVVFRCLQGLFGGGLQPTQQAIILDTFKPSQRSGAFAVTRSRRSSRRSWDRRSAAGSPTTTAGAGSSSSTFRSASRCAWPSST